MQVYYKLDLGYIKKIERIFLDMRGPRGKDTKGNGEEEAHTGTHDFFLLVEQKILKFNFSDCPEQRGKDANDNENKDEDGKFIFCFDTEDFISEPNRPRRRGENKEVKGDDERNPCKNKMELACTLK